MSSYHSPNILSIPVAFCLLLSTSNNHLQGPNACRPGAEICDPDPFYHLDFTDFLFSSSKGLGFVTFEDAIGQIGLKIDEGDRSPNAATPEPTRSRTVRNALATETDASVKRLSRCKKSPRFYVQMPRDPLRSLRESPKNKYAIHLSPQIAPSIDFLAGHSQLVARSPRWTQNRNAERKPAASVLEGTEKKTRPSAAVHSAGPSAWRDREPSASVSAIGRGCSEMRWRAAAAEVCTWRSPQLYGRERSTRAGEVLALVRCKVIPPPCSPPPSVEALVGTEYIRQ
ncbi:hypothetical protein B0H12DRAFT_1080083 [Mycena haematopus]|nr:hypothetical protein B0H12DRAFT_1080083 [Mycena haematopus]